MITHKDDLIIYQIEALNLGEGMRELTVAYALNNKVRPLS